MKAEISDGVLIIQLPVRFLLRLTENDEGLTLRELQAMNLMKQGLSNKHIAQEMKITLRTANHHTSNVIRKLGKTRTEIIKGA